MPQSISHVNRTQTTRLTTYRHVHLSTVKKNSTWADTYRLFPIQLEARLPPPNSVGSLQTKFVAGDPNTPDHPLYFRRNSGVLAEPPLFEETERTRRGASSVNSKQVVRRT